MISKIRNLHKNINYVLQDRGMMFLLNRVIYRLSELLITPYAILKIKTSNSHDMEKCINISFNHFKGLIRPFQFRYEISGLINYLEKKEPKYVIEIGTANGGTLFLFSKTASKDATIISIDLPKGKFGGGYPKWKILLYNSFKSHQQKLHLIRSDSHAQETLHQVKNILKGNKADFIFIDGDHTYEGVKKDFEMYSNLINEDGIIAFHDIVPGHEKDAGGVFKFWKEIKHSYRVKEIVKNWDQNGGGIGILEYGKSDEDVS